ncbi:SOS response-associated peptidase [Alphaproteobacteria bacterium GH1-50]|uniref:Abasic site processing protein n=1 Tax=Kangsaoukella pontilimi TaxID=2691042 RepID=A0A7C9IJT3_9RHOB|nr:SOS response-associated peptidase [Kangsaoukella pontilimi]MXQ09102.1 SOS response-associated peptidase [Kangsaoukella pontilimi]
MPGRVFLTAPLTEVAAWMGADAGDLSEPPRRNIAPGQEVVVCTAERRLVRMRWGIIPVGRVNARGRPVLDTIVNARSETVFDKSAFEGVGRAVVPVNGWYEWTGAARRKTAWRIRPSDSAPFLAFAAITDRWQAPGGRVLDQVATVTTEPNADVAPIHHRMAVILEPADVGTWLTGSEDAARALCRPWPEGRLHIEEAKDVDWQAP